MKPLALALAAALTLTACGADGPPERPQGGLTVSGNVEFGIEGGTR